jgi:hypothetical protein
MVLRPGTERPGGFAAFSLYFYGLLGCPGPQGSRGSPLRAFAIRHRLKGRGGSILQLAFEPLDFLG